jgi:hypothetical protein
MNAHEEGAHPRIVPIAAAGTAHCAVTARAERADPATRDGITSDNADCAAKRGADIAARRPCLFSKLPVHDHAI